MALSEFDQYGIQAQFGFNFEANALSNLKRLNKELSAVNGMIKQLETGGSSQIHSTEAIKGQTRDVMGLKRGYSSLGSQAQRTSQKVEALNQAMAAQTRKELNRYTQIEDTIASISQEAQNVKFDKKQFGTFSIVDRDTTGGGEGTAFKNKIKELEAYQKELRDLGSTLDVNIAKERRYGAEIKRQEAEIKSRIDLIREEDTAMRASYRVGEFSALKNTSRTILRGFQSMNAINPAADFEAGMSKVQALSGEKGAMLESYRQQAKDLGASTRYTATQVAGAQSFLAMAGFKGTKITEAMPAMLNLATAGELGLEDTADIVSNAIGAFKLEASQASEVADVFAKTATSTNTSVSQMAEAFNYAASAASSVGLSVAETGAFIGMAGNLGTQASSAGTGLRAGLLNMISPKKIGKLKSLDVNPFKEDGTVKNAVELVLELQKVANLDKQKISPELAEKLGELQGQIDSGEIADGDVSKEIDALTQKYALSGKLVSTLADVFGKTAIPFWLAEISQASDLAAQSLANVGAQVDQSVLSQFMFNEVYEDSSLIYKRLIQEQGSYSAAVEALNKNIAMIKEQHLEGAGAAALMAGIMEKNLRGAFVSLGSAIEGFFIAYIEPILPFFIGVVNAITALIRVLTNLWAPIRLIISSGIVLGLTLSSLGLVIGTLGTAFFAFSRATAMANVATITLGRNLSSLPVTFFNVAQTFEATNPLETFFLYMTKLGSDFMHEWNNNFEATRVGATKLTRDLGNWANQVKLYLLSIYKTFALSPFAPMLLTIGLITGAMMSLDYLLQKAGVHFSFIATTIEVISAPFLFLWGMLKGIRKLIGEIVTSFLNLFNISKGTNSLFLNIRMTLLKNLRAIENTGESFGYALAAFLLSPITLTIKAIQGAINTLMANMVAITFVGGRENSNYLGESNQIWNFGWNYSYYVRLAGFGAKVCFSSSRKLAWSNCSDTGIMVGVV
jgi:TP901 family phage tail tape measure protein